MFVVYTIKSLSQERENSSNMPFLVNRFRRAPKKGGGVAELQPTPKSKLKKKKKRFCIHNDINGFSAIYSLAILTNESEVY